MSVVSLARIAGFGVNEHVDLASQACERSHYWLAAIVFQDQFGDENRVRDIRKRVVVSLACVHAAQRIKISLGVSTDWHDLEHTIPQKRMPAGDNFRDIKSGGTGCDSVRRERGLGGGRNRLLRQGVRQRFEGIIILERKVRAFIRLDQRDDGRSVAGRVG